MSDRFDIRDGMEVVGSDGVGVGRVRDVESHRIVLAHGAAADGTDQRFIPMNRVDRVTDGRVVLMDTAAVTVGGFGARVAEAVGDPVDPDANLIVGRKPGRNTLLWIVGALIFAAFVFFIYNRTKTEQREKLVAPAQIEKGPVSPVGTGATQPVALPNGRTLQLPPESTALQLALYLAGSDAAPQSFPLTGLAFGPAQAAPSAANGRELELIAQVLAAYPEAEAEIIGYGDPDLARRRAEAVTAAMVERGAPRDRLEAKAGGADARAASGPTATPVELVVTDK